MLNRWLIVLGTLSKSTLPCPHLARQQPSILTVTETRVLESPLLPLVLQKGLMKPHCQQLLNELGIPHPLTQHRMASNFGLQILSHMLVNPYEQLGMRRMRLQKMDPMTIVLGQTMVLSVHSQTALCQSQLHFQARLSVMLHMVVPQDLDWLIDIADHVIELFVQTRVCQRRVLNRGRSNLIRLIRNIFSEDLGFGEFVIEHIRVVEKK